MLRDGHCRWPGCNRPGWQCDVHHVVAREHGGLTVIENCALLCKFHHHRGAHNRDITVTMTPTAPYTSTTPKPAPHKPPSPTANSHEPDNHGR